MTLGYQGTVASPNPAKRIALFAITLLIATLLQNSASGDTIPAAVLDPNLQVTNFLSSGITQPIGIVFIGANDALILEKSSGQVKRITGGVLQPSPVLDLGVKSA